MNISFSLETANPVHVIIIVVVICLFLVVKTAITASFIRVICTVLTAPLCRNKISEIVEDN